MQHMKTVNYISGKFVSQAVRRVDTLCNSSLGRSDPKLSQALACQPTSILPADTALAVLAEMENAGGGKVGFTPYRLSSEEYDEILADLAVMNREAERIRLLPAGAGQ